MAKESNTSPDYRNILRLTGDVTKLQKATISNVTISNGVMMFAGDGYIKLPKILNGTYSIRIRFTSIDPSVGKYLIDFRNADGTGTGYIYFSDASTLSSTSGEMYVGGFASSTVDTTTKEVVVSGIAIKCFEIFVGSKYDGSVGGTFEIDFVEIYNTTLSYHEIVLLNTNNSNVFQTLTTKNYLSLVDQKTQGLQWDENNDTYKRLGTISAFSGSISPGNANLPIHSKMRGCVLKDDGTVNYYLNATNWNYKEDGITPSILTGLDGQVMVEIPAFYYRYDYSGGKHSWRISEKPCWGFTLHPAFITNKINSKVYIAAYEAVLYDVSALKYANGLYLPAHSVTFSASTKTISTTADLSNPYTSLEVGDKIAISGTTNNNTTFTIATTGDTSITVLETVVDEVAANTVIQTERDYINDKLSSISGKVPITYFARSQGRVMAANRGAGWSLLSYDIAHAIQILGLIEYGTFYWQNIAELGPGLTSVSGWDKYNNYNPFAPSGNGNDVGNMTVDNAGGSVIGIEKTKYSKYRGIESFYGHIWKFVDGFNINNNKAYITNNLVDFKDNVLTNYAYVGTLINKNGYQKKLINSSRVMLPSEVGGFGNKYVTDYYYQASGWRIALLGGAAIDGASAGAWFWGLYNDSGNAAQYFGARLAFLK